MNINNNQVFLKLLNQPNYTFTTESPTATVRIVYLNLPVLTSDNAKNVIVTITSNPFLQAVETATIDIQVLSPASHPQLWAFSDFTVIYQQCGNCSTR